jgi:hypothetical protein
VSRHHRQCAIVMSCTHDSRDVGGDGVSHGRIKCGLILPNVNLKHVCSGEPSQYLC